MLGQSFVFEGCSGWPECIFTPKEGFSDGTPCSYRVSPAGLVTSARVSCLLQDLPCTAIWPFLWIGTARLNKQRYSCPVKSQWKALAKRGKRCRLLGSASPKCSPEGVTAAGVLFPCLVHALYSPGGPARCFLYIYIAFLWNRKPWA